jgi:VanZ family protein
VKNIKRLLVLEGRVLLVVSVVIISTLALKPSTSFISPAISDKIQHAFAFYVLSLLVDFAFPKSPFNAVKIFILLGYGSAIETFQMFVPGRKSSFGDLVADGAGMVLFMLSVPLLKRIPVIRERWLSS